MGGPEEEGVAVMRKPLAIILLTATAAAMSLAGSALGGQQHARTPATVTVAMHDPGCHWFSAGGRFTKSLVVKGPVQLANLDEATLRVQGRSGTLLDRVGKKITLSRGSYRITMVGQAPDDNTLRLVIT
jgi:hypothetical protein